MRIFIRLAQLLALTALILCIMTTTVLCHDLTTTFTDQPSTAPTTTTTLSSNTIPTGLRFEQSSREQLFQQLLLDQLSKDNTLTQQALLIPRPSTTITLTATQLSLHNGHSPLLPIYISIRRRLYDVTDGWKYYGADGRYNYLAGKEVGRGLATGCLESSGLTADMRGLSESQLEAVNGWIEFYSGKYKHVGYLKGMKVVEGSAVPDDRCEEAERYGGRPI